MIVSGRRVKALRPVLFRASFAHGCIEKLQTSIQTKDDFAHDKSATCGISHVDVGAFILA